MDLDMISEMASTSLALEAGAAVCLVLTIAALGIIAGIELVDDWRKRKQGDKS